MWAGFQLDLDLDQVMPRAFLRLVSFGFHQCLDHVGFAFVIVFGFKVGLF